MRFLLPENREIRAEISFLSAVTIALIAASFFAPTAHAGLIASWSGDGDADDSVAGRNGTLVNGAGFDSGRFGQSFRLDGVNDYVSVPDDDVWTFGSDPFTISLWANFDVIKPGSLEQAPNLFIGHDQGSGAQSKWVLFYDDDGNLVFHINGTGSVFLTSPTTFFATVGQWHHFALTRSGSTYTFYADGVSLGTRTASQLIPNANAALTFGQAEGLGFFDGRLDDIKIFDEDLSAMQISQLSTISEPKYSSDFESGVPPEFSGITTTESVQGFSEHGFSGNFLRNLTSDPPEKTTLTLGNLPEHDFISIGFLLAIIDTWDGPATAPVGGPDFFNVTLDGNLIFSEHFQNAFEGEDTYAAPPGVLLVEKTQLGFRNASENDRESGFSMGNDPAFQKISHTASTAVIEWFASGSGWDHTGVGGAADESWAIDDVFVTLSSIGDSPTISLTKIDVNTLELIYTGVLQESDDLIQWDDVSPQPICPWQFSPSGSRMFFRAREY